MLEHIELFFKSIFIDNMVFAVFLGMCSYLAVSKKVTTAVGLGAAVIFVLAVTVPLNWLLDKYLLQDGALVWLGPEYADYNLGFLSFILFIATIATMVQLVEIVVEKFSPSLYNSLGIFLPLIAVNCAILGGSLFMQSRQIETLGLALIMVSARVSDGFWPFWPLPLSVRKYAIPMFRRLYAVWALPLSLRVLWVSVSKVLEVC